jgi:hypothetical protein
MGGIGTLPMDYGQSLQVPQQMPTNFSSAQSITSNPLLNYGQPQLGAAGGTPLTMRSGGISRLGYQEGGMDQMMQPQMQDPMMQEQMMQSQMQQTPEGIMSMMPQAASGGQQTQLGEGDNALLTIIQLLIEQGIDPETAQKIARQILQAFAQGGEPAVEALANQLDQPDGMQETMMMADGGITNIYPRQRYFIGKAVKSIGKAVKSIVKSDIGKIALTIGATMLLGPAGAGVTGGMFGAAGLGASLTTNAFLAGAINAGAANLLVQGITTGKFNPKEALMASVLGGATGYLNPASTGVSGGLTADASTISQGGLTDAQLQAAGQTSTLSSNLSQNIATPVSSLTAPPSTSISSTMGLMQPQNPLTVPTTSYPGLSQESTLLGSNTMAPQPTYFETAQAVAKDPSLSGVKYLAQEGLSNVYDYAKTNSTPLLLGTGLGSALRPQAIGESDEDYQNYLKNRNTEVAKFEDIYRTGIRGVNAAKGGRIGYEYGSMPMGEPRKNPAGIMELDYRAKGGFVPPVGIKEKADDIPAMLSNNEFVFTADAVRNAGGGNVNKGAQRMYGLMKQLEAGGMV